MDTAIGLKDQKQKIQSKLFEAVYQLPQLNQEIKNYQQLDSKIQVVCAQLNNQAKTNIEQIERVCKANYKLFAAARMLRQSRSPKQVPENTYWLLISRIIDMFTLMLTSNKMIQFFNKHSIPFSIYRIVCRIYCTDGKFKFLKRTQVQRSLKFILKMLSIRSKDFPRLYASLILNILNQISEKEVQKGKRPNQDLIVNKQIDRMVESMKTIINIALDLIKLNLRIAAESGVLVTLYRRALQNELNLNATLQLIQTISQHMNTQDNRDIILSHLDLSRAFAFFTNVDFKYKDGKNDERIERSAIVVQNLLTFSSTLYFFIHEKVTLKNFVISLKSKSKSERQLNIINQKIFKRLIDKALRYDRNKMHRSNNVFGLNSNYLNHRALLILSFFLDSTELFEIYLNTDPNGSLFAGLGKISLMYFPITFQKGKYNKQIIQTIKLPSASDYQRLNKEYLSILSYYDDCIIPYQFNKNELISYLLYIKQKIFINEQISKQMKQQIEQLLINAKKMPCQDFFTLLLHFYTLVMRICQVLPWKPQYLKLCKYVSEIVGYLRNHDYQAIIKECFQVVSRIFTNPKPNYYRYLYITALDNIGKYFQDHQLVQELILTHYRDSEYSFRISRILLHTDLNKNEKGLSAISHKKILQTICDEGCEELILQIIEIIRFYCIDYDDKADWGAQIICEKLVYNHSEQIACAAVQFCEEYIINHRNHKSLLYKIKLANIKDHNLRKRIMYLLLNSEKGIQLLNAYNPSFIKDEIYLWLKEGPNQIKEFSNFLSRESKKFIANKDVVFLDMGKISENRHKLIFLPWNVHVNQKNFIALASYKYLEQKIKLRLTPDLLIQSKIEVTFFDIGGFTATPNSSDAKTTISVKRQQVNKYYERNRMKENKEIKKFAITKQNTTFFFKYETGCLVLKKIIIDIPLARDVYRSITYPLSFLTLMTKTGKGFAYLREQKFIQQCIKFCQYREDKDEKDIDIQLSKGSIQCLGLLFACWKLEMHERIDIFAVVVEVFEKTNNFQLKEAALWVLNIIVKDDDLRKKLKESKKGWLILQSKYCSWMCYPKFQNATQFLDKSINQFSHIMPPLLPQRIGSQPYRLILAVLDTLIKDDIETQIVKKNQMNEYFKKVQNRQFAWDSKLLERVVMYMSAVNFGIEKTHEIFDLFTEYYLSEKFDTDFAFGSSLP